MCRIAAMIHSDDGDDDDGSGGVWAFERHYKIYTP